MSWRYLGDKAWAQYWVFNIIKTTFELGLWKYEELESLVLQLFTKLESISTLENATILDVKKGVLSRWPKYILKMAQLMMLCREQVSEICVHIAVLVNDHVFESCINRSSNPNPLNLSQCVERLFFNDNHKSEQIYSVITRFLMKSNRIEDNLTDEILNTDQLKGFRSEIRRRIKTENLQRNLVDLFHFITDANKDIWMTSMKFNNQFTP